MEGRKGSEEREVSTPNWVQPPKCPLWDRELHRWGTCAHIKSSRSGSVSMIDFSCQPSTAPLAEDWPLSPAIFSTSLGCTKKALEEGIFEVLD